MLSRTVRRAGVMVTPFCIVASTHALAQQAAPPPDEPDALFGVEEIIVTGTAVSERTKFDSSVAISTFDADTIAQQAPASSADLISSVPGFWVESTAGTTQGNVFARGIIQDGGYRYVGLMEDGIPIYPVFELSFYNPDQFVRVDETIDRVEALRGGTAPIFTPGAIGGTINFVTRSPGEVAEGIVKVGIGDYGMYRGDFSYTTPLSDDWGVALGGYYRSSDGIRDPGYTADEGGQIRAKLLRRFDSGELEFFAKYINDRSMFVVPIPLQGDPSDPHAINGQDAGTYSLHSADLARAGLPVSAEEVGLRGSSLEDGIHPDLATGGFRFKWQMNDTVTFTNLARYTDGSVRFDGIFPGVAPVTGVEYAADAGVVPDYSYLDGSGSYDATQFVQAHGHWVVNKEYEAFQDDIRFTFELGANNLTLGAYYADYSMADRWSLGNLMLMDVRSRPRRLSLPGVTDPDGFVEYSFSNLLADYDATEWSLYLSDEWQATDRLRIDVGVRYDSEDIDTSVSNATTMDLDGNPATLYDNETSQAGTGRTRNSYDFDATGWSIGFNYEFADGQAIYGHYTEAAKLPHFDDVRNGVLQKDNVENVELGYKVSLRSLALFATLFQTEFDNVPFQDILANGDIVVRRASTRTRGVELEGEWMPVESLAIRFNATWQEPEYEDFSGSVVDNTGNTIRRIPDVMGRLTPTWYFMDDRGRAYLTWTYVGKRYANDENTIVLPSYNKLDAGVMFDITEQFSVQVSGDNLTDEIGLTEGNPRTDVGASGIGAVYMARPLFGRSFMGSATFRF